MKENTHKEIIHTKCGEKIEDCKCKDARVSIMTNPLITKIQEAEKEFDERFSLEFFSTEDWQYDYRETPSEIDFKTWQENATNGARTKKDMIKSFHRSTIISLLQAEIERMKGELKLRNEQSDVEKDNEVQEYLIGQINFIKEQITYYQECVDFLIKE